MDFIRKNINKTNRNGINNLFVTNTSNGGGSSTTIGNFLPAINNGDDTYTVDISRVLFTGDVIAEGEVAAFGVGYSGGGSGSTAVAIIDNLTSTATDCALSANQGRVLKDLIDNSTSGNSLSTLQDVKLLNLADGQILKYDAETNKWVNGDGTKVTWVNIEGKPAELTDANIINWNDAAIKKHEHTNKTILDGINSALTTNWNAAYTHTTDATKHITAEERTSWNGVVTNWNKAFYFDSLNNLRVKLNLVGDGEVSAYGAGESSGGGAITIVDSLTSTATDAALSANQGRVLKNLIDNSGGGVSSWNDLLDKPTFFTPAAHTHNYTSTVKVGSTAYAVSANTISLPAYPTTLPASDVSDWAKAVSKPSYSWSEIGSKPSTFTPAAHNHTIANITNLQTTLDGKAAASTLSTHTSNTTVHITASERTNWNGVVTNWNKAFYFDSLNNLRVKLNLVGDGEVSAYGAGESSGGGAITIVDSLTSTAKDAALSANQGRVLKNLIDGKSSVTSWNDLTDKPSWIGSSKPSYLWSEIGSKPTTFAPDAHNQSWSTITSTPTSLAGYGITDGFQVIAQAAPVGANNMCAGFWDTVGSYASFVQLGYGGQFKFDGNNAFVRYIVNGKIHYDWRTIITSSNYNGYSPTLTGGGANGMWSISVTGSAGNAAHLPTKYVGGVQVNPQVYFGKNIGLKVAMTGAWGSWSDTLWVNGYNGDDVLDMCALHFKRNGHPRIAISAQKSTAGIYENIYEIFTDYNASSKNIGSATKLQTARTIWGQSFNGTGNVDGDILITGGADGRKTKINAGGSVMHYAPSAAGWAHSFLSYNNAGGTIGSCCGTYGTGGNLKYYYYGGVYDSPKAVILPNGNMGIGTTAPTRKLEVVGDILANGKIKATQTIYTDVDVQANWFMSNGTTGWYSRDYGGGLHMTDTTWVRIYNGKKFYCGNDIKTDASVITPRVELGSTYGLAQINTGNGDNATFANHNLIIRSWFGVGFRDNNNNCNLVINTRTGNVASKGAFKSEKNTHRISSWSNLLNPTNAVFYVDPIYNVANDHRQNILGWQSTLTTGYTARYAIGSYRPAHSFGCMYLAVGNSDNGAAGRMLSLWGDGKMEWQGNIIATGEVTAYSSSDKKLKKGIKSINSSLAIIDKLNPVQFRWNKKAKELNTAKDDRNNYGLIAQEVEEVLPELIHPIYKDYKSVDYEQLIPILIGAIKELKDEIDSIKKQIK